MVDWKMQRGRKALLCRGVSFAALAMMGFGASAQAQDSGGAADDNNEMEEVVVVGVRGALDSARAIKRNAPTFVDSITATDIGAFPDKSVSEALQRVPGITVSRLQSADDSTHPSGEPTSVLIRGLPQVRTEFNGRDSFSADAARGLNFNDVSPELMAGVDSYKNQTADMIEGGIAGTVNLRTRLPLDNDGLLVSGVVKGLYGDRSDKVTGEVSGIISNTWDTSSGRFGLMANIARSHVVTRTENVIMDKIDTYCSDGAVDADGKAVVNSDGSVNCNANPFGGSGWAFAPDGIRYSLVDYDRTRRGISLAGQYANHDGTFEATVQYTESKYHNAWLENASHVILEGTYFGTPAFRPRNSTILGPASGTAPLMFGADGMLESGTITQGHGSWRGSWGSLQEAIDTGSAVPGKPFVNYCDGGPMCDTYQDGLYFQNEGRNFDHEEKTQDISFNVKWDPTERLHAVFDLQHIKASTTNDDILVATGSMADMQYSVDKNGTPKVTMLPGSNVNYAEGGLSNPHNYWIPFIQAHLEDNDAKETAARADFLYDIDNGGWLNSIKVGVRYADRKQTVRYSAFNWTPIAAPWNCNGPGFNADGQGGDYPAACGARPAFNGYGQGLFDTMNLGNDFFNGNVFPNGDLVYLSRETVMNRDALVQGLSGPNTNSPIAPGWVQICDRPELAGSPNGCFLPSEVMHVQEKTSAAYAMLNFGGDDTVIFDNVTVQGNIGARIVRTEINSQGSVGFPTDTALSSLLNNPCGTALPPGSVVNPACYLTDDILSFANGSGTPDDFDTDYTNVLPSLNVRFGLDQKNYIRFAVSRAMSRPDFGLLRNFVSIQSPVIDTSADSPYVKYDANGNVNGYDFVFRAESGYAGLKPLIADQLDISYERYMENSSLFSFGVFYKKLRNSIAYGEFVREFTNDEGSTQTVRMRGPRNGDSGGELYGFETGYQTFFDFLPGIWSGLGIQANYTYVEQSGINNSNLAIVGALDSGGTGGFGAGLDVTGERGSVIDSHKLAGISKHTFNIVGLYEKGPIGLRLAYNWRSRFLTNNLDCCIGLPVFQKSSGFLDGSIRYSINDNIEVSFEASNILDTTTVFQQQIFGDSLDTPGAAPVYRDANWSKSDRRFQLGARVKF